MTDELDREVSDMSGDAALPRKNGELVFHEPWEGRAFGIAVAMNQCGVYGWADFRDKLVEAIDADESNEGPASYYQRWVRALEQISLDNGLVTLAELDVRTERYADDEEGAH